MKNLAEIPINKLGKIYRSAMPFGKYDLSNSTFSSYLQNKVAVVVMLVSSVEAQLKSGRDLAELYTTNGIEIISLPIPDFSVPDPDVLVAKIDQVLSLLEKGVNVAVHCNAGLGRTGMFLACLAKKSLNISGNEAIFFIRNLVPESIETSEQEQVVIDF